MWNDLEEAMRQPFLDPLVVVMSDMLGEPYGSTRVDFLEFIEAMTTRGLKYRTMLRIHQDLSSNGAYWLETMMRIDPLLAAWFVANEAYSSISQAREIIRLRPAGDAVEAVAMQMLSTFSMEANQAEIAIDKLNRLSTYYPSEARSFGGAIDKLLARSIYFSWISRRSEYPYGPHCSVDQVYDSGVDPRLVSRDEVLRSYGRVRDAENELSKEIEFVTGKETRLLGWIAACRAITAYPPTPVL